MPTVSSLLNIKEKGYFSPVESVKFHSKVSFAMFSGFFDVYNLFNEGNLFVLNYSKFNFFLIFNTTIFCRIT